MQGSTVATRERIILGIDPGLANTGWGIVSQRGARLSCIAYGCVSSPAQVELSLRLRKIHEQIGAVIDRFKPTCVGIETVWFGQNITAAFATGQARGAALVRLRQPEAVVSRRRSAARKRIFFIIIQRKRYRYRSLSCMNALCSS